MICPDTLLTVKDGFFSMIDLIPLLISEPSTRFFTLPSYTLTLAGFLPILSAEKFLAFASFTFTDQNKFWPGLISRSLSCTCNDPSLVDVVLLSALVNERFEKTVFTNATVILLLSLVVFTFFSKRAFSPASHSIFCTFSEAVFSNKNLGRSTSTWSIEISGNVFSALLSFFSVI